ncbi:MAG: hypothetical protein ACM3JI_00490, partial [Anaerolineae bacterium]
LFYNVPARKKFQKSAAVCSGEITRLLTSLSLAHPDIGFELIQQDRSALKVEPVLSLDPLDMLGQRVTLLFGEEFFDATFKMTFEDGPYRIFGLIGEPTFTRHQRTGQFLFINRRFVHAPLISFAIRDGYGMRLDKERHPVYVLHLELASDLIDVNVHPQKKEVRFKDERLVRDKISQAVALGLSRSEKTPLKIPEKNEPFASFDEPFDFDLKRLETGVGTFDKLPKWALKEEPILRFKEAQSEKVLQTKSQEIFAMSWKPQAIGLYSHYLFLDGASVKSHVHILKEDFDGILLVDLLAAEARVMFDRLVRENSLEHKSQQLLIPLSLELLPQEIEIVERWAKDFEILGFLLRLAGPYTVLVEALPPFLEASAAPDVLQGMMATFAQEGEIDKNNPLRMEQLFTALSRNIKANKKDFVLQEALQLFEILLETTSPYYCPRGNPTMTTLSLYEIARFFSTKK